MCLPKCILSLICQGIHYEDHSRIIVLGMGNPAEKQYHEILGHYIDIQN